MRRLTWTVLVLFVAGCTNVTSGDPSASPSVTAPVDPGTIPEDELVWAVEQGGGMMPPKKWAPDLPNIAIYGDGTAYLVDWDVDTATVKVGSVDTDALHDFLASAAGSGLFDGVDYGDPDITDMGSTTVSAFYDDAVHKASPYALGEDSGLSGKQKKARADLIAMMDVAAGLVTDPEPYESPERVEVYAVGDPDWDGQGGEPWPGPALETILTQTDNTCGELTGTDAAAAYAAFEQSDEGKFTVNGQPIQLNVNILLPHMTACDD